MKCSTNRRAARLTWRLGSTPRSLGSLGLGGKSERDRRERLFQRVDELLDAVGEPRSLAAAGVDRAQFEAERPELAKAAFSDPSIRTNPRIPLLREIVTLLQTGYDDR
ncbi:MAG: iron-containing alcohol dehydrogenase [Solirubrobacteraceae bacterium]